MFLMTALGRGAVAGDNPRPPPRLCVHPAQGVDPGAHPISILVGPSRETLRAHVLLSGPEAVCFDLDPKDRSFGLRQTVGQDAGAPPTDLCEQPLPGTPRPGRTFTADLYPPIVPGKCPWRVLFDVDDPSAPSMVPQIDFVVLPAVPSYREARALADLAASRLSLRRDWRGAVADGRGGLTFSRRVCAASGRDYPCFITRGRSDDGQYVSIDDASMLFERPTKGYVVVLGSGPAGAPALRALVEKARGPFPAVSLVTETVYQGCIH